MLIVSGAEAPRSNVPVVFPQAACLRDPIFQRL
jgi:hypothetical protein